MRRPSPSLVLLALAMAPCAFAQPNPAPKNSSPPGTETVIVTAPRFHAGITPNAIAHDFVKSFAMSSVLTEQIPRWQTGICPAFLGVAPQYAQVMDYRLRQIAIKAGAPMKDKGCKPNLNIVFTPQPQAYLDSLHAKNVEALGYHGVTTDTHPVQAWYVTATTDIRGQKFLDKDSDLADVECQGKPPFCYLSSTSDAPMSNIGGWRAHPDVTSDLLYATIIVDSTRTAHETVGAIADYVAMLALSRSEDYGDCQLMPSITNLLSACDDKLKPDAITQSDIAYLKGVYKMDPGAKLQIQQDQIAAEMQKSLGGQ